MKNPVLTPPVSADPKPSLQIQQDLQGDENQVIGAMDGGIAIAKIVGNVIYNYYYREESQTVIDASESAQDDRIPCPYRGLFHFGPGDAEYFFGRESFVEELVKATQTRNFIPLLGASGSGKSSVVLAGLVPKLQQAGHWQFTHFRPGADPFHALALALVQLYAANMDETERIRQARNLAGYLATGEVLLTDVFAQIQQNFPGDRVLLIADQFEELYTLCTDETTRRNFLDRLLAGIAAPGDRRPFAPVTIATMRADFLGTALSYRPLADVLQNADLKLGPMNRSELTAVIEKPAQKLGVTFAPGLVERILDDVDAEPGILPLLEFALTELWQRRSGKQLTHAAYEEIGEVQGALGRHANEEYERLSDIDRQRVRRIFIQLVRPGEGAEDTRRIATKAELGEQNWSLVKQLADTRLVVTSRNGVDLETVEVVHEALIRNWGELRGWMDIDRVFRAWQERLRGTIQQWQQTQQDPGSLLRGAALVEAEEQLQQRPEDLASESDFINLSLQERERSQQAETARRRREITTARTITVGSVLAFVVSSGLGLMALRQTLQAQLNLADALSASALNFISAGKGLDAFIPAIRAGKIQQNQQVSNPSAINALQQALNHRSEYNRLEGHQDIVTSMSFSPDGKTFVTSSVDKTVKLWTVATGKELQTFQGHQHSVVSVSFSPDGKTLATGSYDKTVKLWNVATGKELHTFQGHQHSVVSVSFSPDGKTLATGSYDKTVKLWNVDTGKKIHTLQGHQGSVDSLSFSPDGKTLATSNADKIVKLWNVDTGKEISTLQGHEHSVLSMSFSPDGKTFATGSEDHTVKLWNVGTGKEIRTLSGHKDIVTSISFSPDGKTLATGGNDKMVKLWSVDTGKEIHTLPGEQNYLTSTTFSPDGKILATGSDNMVKLWNVATGKEIPTFQGHQDYIKSVSFSLDGQTLATSSEDKTVKLWSLDPIKDIPAIQGHQNSVTTISFSPDGKSLATAGKSLAASNADKTVKLWNVATGKQIRTFPEHVSQYSHTSMSFSPDGQSLAIGSDNMVKLWNVAAGKETPTLLEHQDSVFSMSFSPDGKILATGSEGNTVKLWNVATGKVIDTLQGHENSITSMSFSPDGKTLATGSVDNKVKLWNVDTGKVIDTLPEHQEYIVSLSFSPDGKTLAIISEKKIVLWNVVMGKEIRTENRTLQGHKESFDRVSFSRDGKTLATSNDKKIVLWSLETGKEIRTLQEHDNIATSMSFSPDDKTLAIGSDDGKIILSNLDLDSVMGRSCDWVRDYLEHNINVSESDKKLCDGIGTKKQ